MVSIQIDATELLEEINNAGLGKVIDERTLRRHRSELGLGKAVDVGAYVGSLVDRYQARQTGAVTYEDKKEKARERSAESTKKGQDIGPLPSIVDPERREACRYSLLLFFDTYIKPEGFFAWSDDHLKIFETMQNAILTGGNFALAMPRGSGKTTITEAAALWAILFGHCNFCVIVGATAEKGQELLETIKTYLVAKDLLVEDFPEVCIPVMRLEGQPNRCRGQHIDGARTQISWHDNELVFPTVEGSSCSGSIIRTFGITSKGIRGQKYTNANGDTFRPDLVLLDDPQDDESAENPTQVRKREKVINGTILGMAGPGKSLTAIMPCTVICQDDLAARYLDRKKNPEWQGIRIQMMKSMPANEEIWEEYFAIRRADLEAGLGPDRANAFYRKNRKEMDRGAVPYWTSRFDPGEISAIQHAMHLRDRDPVIFAAEYQNDPINPESTDLVILTADEIAAKVRNYKRGDIPNDTELMVGFVDVQLHCLYYVLAALKTDFSGHIPDYGTWPKQPTKYFAYSNRIANPISRQKTDEGVLMGKLLEDAQIRQALERLVNEDLMLRKWEREDGAEFQLDLLMIDMGSWTPVIKQFIAESPHRARMIPAKGDSRKPTEKRISETKPTPGVEIGEEWIIPLATRKNPVRYLLHDTHHWKSELQKRWKAPIGQPGCWTLYDGKPIEHRMISEHCAAEYANRVSAKGNVVDVWENRPGRDNHLLDCVVGCLVAGSRRGCAVPDASLLRARPRREKKKAKMKFSEVMARKRAEQGWR
ncbi:terminase gpA endonuclease subunit [Bremerella sp. JC817]|uniref:terminase gpA endonuclease subunit n=1 Tax=Bremerella sp. JC817 TaxID=3231756 RepID=UPI00345A90C2